MIQIFSLLILLVSASEKNIIRLNQIKAVGSDTANAENSKEYYFNFSIKNKENGRIYLMENQTNNGQKWEHKAFLEKRELSPNSDILLVYNGPLDDQKRYCLMMNCENGEELYSAPFLRNGDNFVNGETAECIGDNSSSNMNPEKRGESITNKANNKNAAGKSFYYAGSACIVTISLLLFAL